MQDVYLNLNLYIIDFMSEEDLPIPHEEKLKPARKEKLLSKKRWLETVQEWLKLNPESDPAEVLRLTKAIQQYNNPNKTPEEREKARVVETLRQERLRQQGLDPTEWAYHHSTQPQNFGASGEKSMDAPFTEDDMADTASRLPRDIDFFVMLVGISSGSEFIKEENPFKVMNHWWEIYVRVKPQRIEGSSPQIVSPPPQIEGPTPTE